MLLGDMSVIPFNRATFDGQEMELVGEAVAAGHISGNGAFTREAESMLGAMHGGAPVLLTTSCTSALEMAGLLIGLGPGDEVICPAFTFVSTANAFMWNGARPVFADVRQDTLNIDPDAVEGLINERTKAICIVHYGGVGADAERFEAMAAKHGLRLVEDNAHGLGASTAGRRLGTFGSMSTLSFHETKNITCGEGGAIVLQDDTLLERAEVLREKGTNRARFHRGQVDKYTWIDVGSSWVPADLLAAVLVGQLRRFDVIQGERLRVWNIYRERLATWAADNGVQLPHVGPKDEHPAHVFHLRMPSLADRTRFIEHLAARGIAAVFHYQALNASPVGVSIGATAGSCPVSEQASNTLVRLPLYASLTDEELERVIAGVLAFRVAARASS